MGRVRERINIEKEIFRNWQASVRASGAEPMVLFWEKDKSREQFENFLLELNVSVLVCIHPDQGEPITILEDDNHPSAIVPDYWADCVAPRITKISN